MACCTLTHASTLVTAYLHTTLSFLLGGPSSMSPYAVVHPFWACSSPTLTTSLAAQTPMTRQSQMTLWLQVCRDLGVPVSKAKTFLPSRVMEILGLIINTNTMTLSVSQDRLLDILDELEEFSIAKSVRRSDLESLAGKMVFACSVLPGGRTFMRELLDLLNATPRSRRWVRLSAGFRRDIEWWKNFAPKWNGVEAIPPPVTVPPTWLGTDASGDHGLGLFLLGLGIHIPLPLRTIAPLSVEERSLIIAETELMGVVLLAALAAPSFPGGHLLIPCDNTVAISWVDRGTARRPRAMRALRILWRVQARFRIHVSTRYISSERNALADFCVAPRFISLFTCCFSVGSLSPCCLPQ